MEEEKKKNSTSPITIVLLVLVVLLAGYIGYDKFLNNKEENTTKTEEKQGEKKEENTNSEVPATTPVKGECPLTKFDKSYVLTETDKEEIITSLEAMNINFTRQTIKVYTMKNAALSKSNYLMYLTFIDSEDGDELGALGVKVNGKFKVITAGSGYENNYTETVDHTLESICK